MISTSPRSVLFGFSTSIFKSKKNLIPHLIGRITTFVIGCGLPVSLSVAVSIGMFGYWYSHKKRAVSIKAPSIGLKTKKVAAQVNLTPVSGSSNQTNMIDKSALNRFSRLLLLGSPEAISFLKSQPGLLPLKEVVDDCLKYPQSELISAIHVILGIKPALAIENPDLYPADLLIKLKKMITLNSHCCIIEPSSSCKALYFANESPLPQYNPWIYLQPTIRTIFDSSISKAIQLCFPIAMNEQFLSVTDQILPLQVCSYMLGFGPTWEGYMHRKSMPSALIQFEHLHDRWVFSNQHYNELGQALQAHDEEGRLYSINFWKKPKKTLTELDLQLSKAFNMAHYLNLHFVFDEVSLKTPYLRSLIVDANYVTEFLCNYHPAYKAKIPPELNDWVFQIACGLVDL